MVELPAGAVHTGQELEFAAPVSEGAELELSLKDTRLRHTIIQPHEAPKRGRESDRAPRKSSYVKDFKAINMGVMEMKKGNGELTLRALKIPGQEALEFRLLMLRRMEARPRQKH